MGWQKSGVLYFKNYRLLVKNLSSGKGPHQLGVMGEAGLKMSVQGDSYIPRLIDKGCPFVAHHHPRQEPVGVELGKMLTKGEGLLEKSFIVLKRNGKALFINQIPFLLFSLQLEPFIVLIVGSYPEFWRLFRTIQLFVEIGAVDIIKIQRIDGIPAVIAHGIEGQKMLDLLLKDFGLKRRQKKFQLVS